MLLKSVDKMALTIRLLQVGVALIPVVIGFLALLNDATAFNLTVQQVIKPLISLQSDKAQMWRALPVSWAPYLYILMFASEFLVGVLALIGVVMMLRHLTSDTSLFERAKCWIYIACLWGTIVWGLGFFEGAGDWFLAWTSSNGTLSGLQSGALMYVTELLFVFLYLKLSHERLH
jgi:predicted small integral membrane protein